MNVRYQPTYHNSNLNISTKNSWQATRRDNPSNRPPTINENTIIYTQQAVGGRPPRYASAPCSLTTSSYLFARWHVFRLVGYLRHHLRPLTLKVVSESRVTWATSVPILVFLGLSVLELRPMYATDVRQTDVRRKHRLMPPPYGEA